MKKCFIDGDMVIFMSVDHKGYNFHNKIQTHEHVQKRRLIQAYLEDDATMGTDAVFPQAGCIGSNDTIC